MRRNIYILLAFASIAACLTGTRAQTTAQTVAPASTTEPSEEQVDLTTTHLVSLHLKAAMPQAAGAALAAQAGTPMRFNFIAARKGQMQLQYEPHDFDVESKPFVQALLQFCSVYDLVVPGNFRDDEGWQISKRGFWESASNPPRPVDAAWSGSPFCVNGPFAVVAKEISRYRTIDPLPDADADNASRPDGGPRTASHMHPHMADQLQLLIAVLAEPGVTILQRPFFPVVDTLVDDQGKSLWSKPGDDGVVPRLAGADNILLLSLQQPSPTATFIAKFSGYVRLQVVNRVERIAWDHLDDNQEQEVDLDEMRATLTSVKDKTGPGRQVTLTVSRGNTEQAKWAAMVSLVNRGSRIRWFDQSGTMLPGYARWSGDDPSSDHMIYKAHFLRAWNDDMKWVAQKPFRVTWDFPLEAGEVQVPFSFEKLPLPEQ